METVRPSCGLAHSRYPSELSRSISSSGNPSLIPTPLPRSEPAPLPRASSSTPGVPSNSTCHIQSQLLIFTLVSISVSCICGVGTASLIQGPFCLLHLAQGLHLSQVSGTLLREFPYMQTIREGPAEPHLSKSEAALVRNEVPPA